MGPVRAGLAVSKVLPHLPLPLTRPSLSERPAHELARKCRGVGYALPHSPLQNAATARGRVEHGAPSLARVEGGELAQVDQWKPSGSMAACLASRIPTE